MLRAPPGLQALPPARGNVAIHCVSLRVFVSEEFYSIERKTDLIRSCLCAFPGPLAKEKPLKSSEHHVHPSSFSSLYFISLRPSRESARFRRVFSDQIEYPSIREIARVRMRRDANTWDKPEVGCSAACEGYQRAETLPLFESTTLPGSTR